MRWDLHVAAPARKQLERLPAKDLERILGAMTAMRDNPFQGDVQHLKSQSSAFRRRVGDWRILFDADPAQRLIVVTAVLRRTTTTIVGAFAAKTHLSTLLEEVERGEEITITRHGKAVARLVPIGVPSRADLDRTVARLKSFRKGRRLGKLSARALIVEGRR